MSDDWAVKYIDIHKQKQQEKRDLQERARLARLAAPDVFQRIKDRVRQDIETFHAAGALVSLEFNNLGLNEFALNDMASTSKSIRPTLVVRMESIVVTHTNKFPPREGEKHGYESVGALRVCSDLSGVTHVYRNGSGDAFADESEISEFLLKPILDYIDG